MAKCKAANLFYFHMYHTKFKMKWVA